MGLINLDDTRSAASAPAVSDEPHVQIERRTKLHRGRQVGTTKANHDRVCVAIDNLGIMVISIFDAVLALDLVFGHLDHLTTIGCDTGRDGETWQFANRRSRETVDRVSTDLEINIVTRKHLLRSQTFKAS